LVQAVLPARAQPLPATAQMAVPHGLESQVSLRTSSLVVELVELAANQATLV
jgi:hypothetical protein